MATNSVGAVATLAVNFAPIVGTNPTSQSVSAGSTVTFTAAATGNSTPTVQWQVSSDGGVTFHNISGASTTALTIASVSASQNGYRYHAVFTNSLGTATTATAVLTVM